MMGGSIGSSRDDVPEEQPSLPIRRQSVFLSTRGEVGSSGKLGLSTRGEVGSSGKFARRKQKQPFELQSMWLTETEFDKDVWTPGDAGQLLKLYRDTPHRIARLCAVLSPLNSADRHRMQNHVAMAIGWAPPTAAPIHFVALAN
ncbi:unnamed protein product [Symbiodinium natans]|uniref:Uncharacterized protein n=1 Tax=Symbiodinium natans TaxID=878477 RepID=A0A812RHW9_9DINO|nr:unnamed protein product [Symbiodinium natans]